MSFCLEEDLVKYSNIYGRIDLDTSKLFDDSQDLGGTEDTFLNYIIKQIKIYTKKINNKKIIYAIQLTYNCTDLFCLLPYQFTEWVTLTFFIMFMGVSISPFNFAL